MLGDLVLKNFAIIDEVSISFTDGLNIITGETGAGKSVIVGAMEMLFGGRASTDVIKDGRESAFIEASYFISESEDIDEIISQAGVEPNPESLILSREIRRSGRNRCRINGQLVPLWLVREVSRQLVDIHGQHEHQNLLHSSNHIDILDDLLPGSSRELKSEVADKYSRLQKLKEKKKKLTGQESDRARRMDVIEYQLEEIDAASLEEGEIEKVEQELARLNNSERIYETTGEAGELICGGDFNEPGLLDRLGQISSSLEEIAEFDEELKEIHELAENIYYSLQDLGFRIQDYHENQEFDPGRIKKLEERLDTINSLRRKYGDTVSEILEYRDELQEEYQQLNELEDRLEEIEDKMVSVKEQYIENAKKLSRQREKTAEELEEKLREELKDLALEEARFKVQFEERDNPSEKGLDSVEFLIAVNPGTRLKPLSRVASGGEISRIMLAFKSITARYDRVHTMIFDEVDAGVGGRTALKVADKLARISSQRQIICITHLPQLASMADRHFYIEKETDREKETVEAEISRLEGEERKTELARMLGAADDSETGIEHAEELMERAESKKV